MNDYSYFSSVTFMLNQFNWPTLELRRGYLKLVMLYKIAKGLIEIPSIFGHHALQTVTRGHPCRFQTTSAVE